MIVTDRIRLRPLLIILFWDFLNQRSVTRFDSAPLLDCRFIAANGNIRKCYFYSRPATVFCTFLHWWWCYNMLLPCMESPINSPLINLLFLFFFYSILIRITSKRCWTNGIKSTTKSGPSSSSWSAIVVWPKRTPGPFPFRLTEATMDSTDFGMISPLNKLSSSLVELENHFPSH